MHFYNFPALFGEVSADRQYMRASNHLLLLELSICAMGSQSMLSPNALSVVPECRSSAEAVHGRTALALS